MGSERSTSDVGGIEPVAVEDHLGYLDDLLTHWRQVQNHAAFEGADYHRTVRPGTETGGTQ